MSFLYTFHDFSRKIVHKNIFQLGVGNFCCLLLESHKQNNLQMKHFINTSSTHNGYILQSNTECTTVCCPSPGQHYINVPVQPFKKDKRFIQLTIGKRKYPIKLNKAAVSISDQLSNRMSTSSLEYSLDEFKQDKSTFLQQIRNYVPSSQLHKQQEKQRLLKSTGSTKQFDTTPKKNETGNLSALLDSLSSEIFSDMFVSSSVKEKIMLSGSLGSISEVRSEMEISNPTESIINHLNFTEQR